MSAASAGSDAQQSPLSRTESARSESMEGMGSPLVPVRRRLHRSSGGSSRKVVPPVDFAGSPVSEQGVPVTKLTSPIAAISSSMIRRSSSESISRARLSLAELSLGRLDTDNAPEGSIQFLKEIMASESDHVQKEALSAKVLQSLTRTEVGKVVSFFNEIFDNYDACTAEEMVDLHLLSKAISIGQSSSNASDVSSQIHNDIIVFGSINMDLVAQTDSFPKPNSTQPGHKFQTLPGGKGANEAVACGKLGAPCFMIGRVGDDDFGKIMLARLSEYVNVDAVSLDNEEGTGVAMIISALDTKAKTNTTCAGANDRVGDDEITILTTYLERVINVRLLLLCLEVNTAAVTKAAEVAFAKKKLVVLRAAPLTEEGGICDKLWDNIHVVVVSEAELPTALGVVPGKPHESGLPNPLQNLRQCTAAARLLMQRGTNLVAVLVATGFGVVCHVNVARGKAMDYELFDEDSDQLHAHNDPGADEVTIVLPNFREKVVDVIGAADALTGGFTAALSHGVPLYHALIWGTGCAGRSITAIGAQESMPTLSELQTYLAAKDVYVVYDEKSRMQPTTWPTTRPLVSGAHHMLEEQLHGGQGDKMISSLEKLPKEHDIDQAIDFQGHSLLTLAIMYEASSCTVALLRHGADPLRKDNYGMTVLDRCHELYAAAYRQKQKRLLGFIKFCILLSCKVNFFLTERDCAESLKVCKSSYADLLVCGNRLNRLASGKWADALLGFMLLYSDDEACAELQPTADDRAAVSHLCTWLLNMLMQCDTMRGQIHDALSKTIVPNTMATFLHGVAHSCDGETMLNLKSFLTASVSRKSRGWDIVRDHFLFQKDNRSDAHGRTPLHYAAMGANAIMCKVLLQWGHDMYHKDTAEKLPIDYCKDQGFATELEGLLLLKDAFISIGHTPETDRCVQLIAQEATKADMDVWWDKGNQNDGKGIRPGELWTAEIEKAMKGCKVVLVILTKKWLESIFCESEAKCAMSYNKNLIALLPPIPVQERAYVKDLKMDNVLHQALIHRQVFDFTDYTEEQLMRELPRVFDAIRGAAPKFGRGGDVADEQIMDTSAASISEIWTPRPQNMRYAFKKAPVFVVCGASVEDVERGKFARLLANSLLAEGVPVSLGFKPPVLSKDDEYPTLLRNRLVTCSLLILVLENMHDHAFLNSVMEKSGNQNCRTIIVPYSRMEETRDGLSYSAHLTSVTTWCFTDWMGTSTGLTKSSPIYQQVFREFLNKLDSELHD